MKVPKFTEEFRVREKRETEKGRFCEITPNTPLFVRFSSFVNFNHFSYIINLSYGLTIVLMYLGITFSFNLILMFTYGVNYINLNYVNLLTIKKIGYNN